jgi:hypothetical protein
MSGWDTPRKSVATGGLRSVGGEFLPRLHRFLIGSRAAGHELDRPAASRPCGQAWLRSEAQRCSPRRSWRCSAGRLGNTGTPFRISSTVGRSEAHARFDRAATGVFFDQRTTMQSVFSRLCGAREGNRRLNSTRQDPLCDVSKLDRAREPDGSARRPCKGGGQVKRGGQVSRYEDARRSPPLPFYRRS